MEIDGNGCQKINVPDNTISPRCLCCVDSNIDEERPVDTVSNWPSHGVDGKFFVQVTQNEQTDLLSFGFLGYPNFDQNEV
jgi:hypothetical protein